MFCALGNSTLPITIHHVYSQYHSGECTRLRPLTTIGSWELCLTQSLQVNSESTNLPQGPEHRARYIGRPEDQVASVRQLTSERPPPVGERKLMVGGNSFKTCTRSVNKLTSRVVEVSSGHSSSTRSWEMEVTD